MKTLFSLLILIFVFPSLIYGQNDHDWKKGPNFSIQQQHPNGGILVYTIRPMYPDLGSSGPISPPAGLNFIDRVGIGTEQPVAKLHVKLNNRDESSQFLEILRLTSNMGTTIFYGNEISAKNASGNPAPLFLNKTNKVAVVVPILEITGGSDLAEPFEIAGKEPVSPGMVVSIAPEHPGQLRLASEAYDRTVAGIISGANGLNPGLTMKQEGGIGNGGLPVALAGRVYCWVDASVSPIHPGDMLTSSDTPGHAMKVMDYTQAQGAIIGKAMSSLLEGKGLVLVLVNLQ